MFGQQCTFLRCIFHLLPTLWSPAIINTYNSNRSSFIKEAAMKLTLFMLREGRQDRSLQKPFTLQKLER